MGDDAAAQIRLKTTDYQKDAIVESTLDPFIVALHKVAGLAPVIGKCEQYDEQRFSPLLDVMS